MLQRKDIEIEKAGSGVAPARFTGLVRSEEWAAKKGLSLDKAALAASMLNWVGTVGSKRVALRQVFFLDSSNTQFFNL